MINSRVTITQTYETWFSFHYLDHYFRSVLSFKAWICGYMCLINTNRRRNEAYVRGHEFAKTESRWQRNKSSQKMGSCLLIVFPATSLLLDGVCQWGLFVTSLPKAVWIMFSSSLWLVRLGQQSQSRRADGDGAGMEWGVLCTPWCRVGGRLGHSPPSKQAKGSRGSHHGSLIASMFALLGCELWVSHLLASIVQLLWSLSSLPESGGVKYMPGTGRWKPCW